MRRRTAIPVLLTLMCFVAGFFLTYSVPLTVKDDPLVRMPGSQPGQVNLESPGRCLNCHAGYNTEVEPGFNWKGSMMAHAARDFLFWSCVTVSAQDSLWALGTTHATDLCLRCHFPEGWLAGRSDPTNATAMVGSDFDGVHCDFCHRMYDPFFETTYDGTREGSDWLNAWDETNASSTPSQPAAAQTLTEDRTQAQSISLFNGLSFFNTSSKPVSPSYTENTSGQFFVSLGSQKRAPFADASARHQTLYSRHHKSKYMCGTCHDVSNPALANLAFAGTLPGDGSTILTTEQQAAHSYFHVERTFSEFMLSDYGLEGGSAGIGPFDPGVYSTSNPGNKIGRCQDCHMRDVVGQAANKNGTVVRPNDSIEHPQTGQPLHDMTGGNAWVSFVLASAVPGSPNYDPVNDQLLNQGPGVLTLDMLQGQGIDPVALIAGADRAKQQLLLAAAITNVTYDPGTGALGFRVQNQSGHKLISGFPEGRRMFINVKAYAANQLVYEINPYDPVVGTLRGLPHAASSPPLGPNEIYDEALVYEMHPRSSLTGEDETFHFVLADGRYKDNRIPPKGFRIGEAASRISVPVWHGVEDPGYYSAAEYAGGYDEVGLSIPVPADSVEIGLYYQTTSREYIEFLRDEIKGDGPKTLPEPSAYVVQSHPFFTQLKAWGDTIWQLWLHNKDLPGAAPFLMASATVGGPAGGCNAPTPSILSADGGHTQVTLTWGDLHTADPDVVGYAVYYDQAGKSQLVQQVGLTTSYVDIGLTNDQSYCYKLTSLYAGCESDFSNLVCATPTAGQTLASSVQMLETGRLETTGKGATKVTVFVQASAFTRGDQVVVRSWVVDDTGAPLAGALVDVRLTGPQQVDLVSAPSAANGSADATWATTAPNRKGQGGTPVGLYTATVTGVTLGGYVWDGQPVSVTFTLQ